MEKNDTEKMPYQPSQQNKTSSNKNGIGSQGDAATNQDTTDQEDTADATRKKGLYELEIMCRSKTLTEKAKGDLDVFEDLYESWQSKEENLAYQNKTLAQKIESFEEAQKNSNSKIIDLNKTVELLQASISALHNELNMAEMLGKENREMKLKLNDEEKKIKCLKTALEENEKEYHSKVCRIEKEHKNHVQNIEAEHKKQIDELLAKQDRTVISKENEIAELESKIEEVEKDKQSELIRMSVEYDNKVAKLQRQRAATSLNQQQPSSNQEIFRKKLQHVKSEYEHEINILKEQVASLKSQSLAAEPPRQSRSLFTVGSLAKKIRKQ